MADQPAFSFAVVYEAKADRDTACDLADRVITGEANWITTDTLDRYREWRGVEQCDAFLGWKSVRKEAQSRNIRAHGRFGGEPGAPDAHAARLALLVLTGAPSIPNAVVLIRDTDGDGTRRRGLEQARAHRRWRFEVIIGLAHAKRECWVLAGFDPVHDAEEKRLKQARRDLGFDPRLRAERLTAQHENAKRSAKRVLRYLVNDDDERQRRCWRQASLDALAGRGLNTGLVAYLDEIRKRLIPILLG